jgi:hypothetical protein
VAISSVGANAIGAIVCVVILLIWLMVQAWRDRNR